MLDRKSYAIFIMSQLTVQDVWEDYFLFDQWNVFCTYVGTVFLYLGN